MPKEGRGAREKCRKGNAACPQAPCQPWALPLFELFWLAHIKEREEAAEHAGKHSAKAEGISGECCFELCAFESCNSMERMSGVYSC